MYFEGITLGMTIEIAPAVIEKEKMLAFALTIYRHNGTLFIPLF